MPSTVQKGRPVREETRILIFQSIPMIDIYLGVPQLFNDVIRTHIDPVLDGVLVPLEIQIIPFRWLQ